MIFKFVRQWVILPNIKPVFLLIILLSFSCQYRSGHDDNILRVALLDNPTNLDPRTYTDVASYRIIELVYDFLVRLDTTGLPQPDLAYKWDNPSDTVYIFYLRPNVKFHDSSPLTAYDVAYTFQSILDPQLRAPSRKSFEPIDKIQVLDSLTVKFKLKYPYAPFLANTQVGIVPRHIARDNPDILQRKPMGSGPFVFKKWKSDSYVELAANHDYWKTPPRLEGILVEILPEETTRILALENGEIDFLMNNFPESFLPRFRKNRDLKVEMKTGSNYVYLGLNLRNQFLKNRKVRQAIAQAIDVKGIINNLMGGIHVPAKSLLNPRHWAYNPNLPDYTYSPERAKQLLNEAGYPDPDGDGPGTRFNLSYKCTDKQMSRQKAQLIQEYLKEIGIGIDIQSYEWGTFFEDVQNGRFDMYSLTWVGIYEPDIYYQLFHTDNIGVGANRGGYSNPRVDELIVKAQRTLLFPERKKYYWEIQKILADDLPYISLWYETNVAVMNKEVKNFHIMPAAEWRPFENTYFQKNSRSK